MDIHIGQYYIRRFTELKRRNGGEEVVDFENLPFDDLHAMATIDWNLTNNLPPVQQPPLITIPANTSMWHVNWSPSIIPDRATWTTPNVDDVSLLLNFKFQTSIREEDIAFVHEMVLIEDAVMVLLTPEYNYLDLERSLMGHAISGPVDEYDNLVTADLLSERANEWGVDGWIDDSALPVPLDMVEFMFVRPHKLSQVSTVTVPRA